jgi:hypothetical protein
MPTANKLADQLAVKFAVLQENVRNTKEAIGTGTLADAIREAKQLTYSANTLVQTLEAYGQIVVPSEGESRQL